MGGLFGRREKETVYRTDDTAVNQIREQMKEQQAQFMNLLQSKDEQYKSILVFYQNEFQKREKENKEALKSLELNSKKNNENFEKIVSLLKESEDQHLKKTSQFLKENQENFFKMLEMKHNDVLENYKKICENIENTKKENEQYRKNIEEEFNRKFEEKKLELKREYDNAKTEDQRKEIERKLKEKEEIKRREDKAFNEFKVERKRYLEKKYKELMENFINNELKFCLKDICEIDKGITVKLILNVFDSENVDKIVLETLKDLIRKITNSNLKSIVNHLNILLLGPTGVGKSTLINAIFKEDICPTGQGKPVTKGEPEYIMANKKEGKEQYIRMADSRGIEKDAYGVKQVVNSATNFINKCLIGNDPDKFVHLIWYCITANRFEEIEKSSLIQLSKLYTQKELPIIVVYTQAVNDEFVENMRKMILKEMNINVFFQDVLAKEVKTKKYTIQAFGIDDLLNLSIEKAKNAIDSSCNQALRSNCNISVTTLIEGKSKNIQKRVANNIENEISKIEVGTNIEEASKIIGKIILNIFLEYLNIKNNENKTQEIISNFTKLYFEEILKLFQNRLIQIVKKESEKIANDIMDIQIKINKENDGYFHFKNQMNKEMILQTEYSNLFDVMKDYAELYCIRNACRYIWQPINDLIKEDLGAKYKYCIDNNENLKQEFDEYAAKTFSNINNKLKNL